MKWAWLILPLCAALAWGHDVRVLDDQRWNTVADGPLGGRIINDDIPAAGHRSVRGLRQAPPWFTMLQRHGLLPANQPPPTTPEYWVRSSQGRLITPELDASRQASTLGNPGNRLTWDFSRPAGDPDAVAWSTTQVATLRNYLNAATAETLKVWGAPAFANKVRIVHDPNLNSLEMAAYDATRNEIRIELLNDARSSDPAATVIDDYDLYVLTHAVLLAYRDDAAIGYDSWESGMARAAQLTIISSTKPSFGFLKRDFNLLFGAYDLLNQPGLESPRFRGADTSAAADILTDALGSIRAYMSQAAWLKALAERPGLFADFNAAYYRAMVSAGNSIKYSIPALRRIMTGLIPEVEGLGFADWYTRQYALDTAQVPGAKLYIFGTVAKDFIGGQPTNSFPMSIYHWETTPSNEHRALTGTVRFTYTAYDDFNLTAAVEGASGKGGIEARLGEAGNAPGIASVVPLFFNIEGDQGQQMQRIIVRGELNGMDRRLYFANDVAASDQQLRYDLYGLVTHGWRGKLKIEIEGRDSVETDVIQGAFRARIPGGLPTAARATLTWTPAADKGYSKPDVLRRNVMYLGLLGSGIDAANGEVTLVLDTPPQTATKFTKTIPAGISMISVPAYAGRSNLAEILGVDAGELLLARADGAVTSAQPWRQNEIYRLWPSTPSFQPGYGYWVRTTKPVTLTYEGVPADSTQPYRLWLPPGWQQIGNPFPELLLTVGSLRVQAPDGNAAVSLAQAQTAGLVSSGLFSWAGSTGYRLLSPTSQLTPYAGFWINVLSPKGVTLIFPNSLSPSARATLERAEAADAQGWQVQLSARTDESSEQLAVLGVQAGAGEGYTWRDAPRPPAPLGSHVAVSFPRDDWGAQSGRYVRDLRDPAAGTASWDVLVETDQIGRDVTLSWPSLKSVPGDVSLVLTDLTNGRQQFMRTSAATTFRAAAGGNRFRITASRASNTRLAVLDLGAQVTRARAGTMTYTLSGPATVNAVLYSQAGQRIKALTEGRAAGAGTGSIEFVPTDEAGRPLPNGVYRLDLICVGEDGQQARASRLVVVER